MAANFNKNGVIDCTPIECSDTVNIMKNDIVVGENLLRNTKSYTFTVREGNNYNYASFTPTQPFEADKIYSFSADVEVNTGSTDYVSILLYAPGDVVYYSSTISLKITDGKVSGNISVTQNKTTASNAKLLIYSGRAGETSGIGITVKNFKLEEGPIATPWCPAPLDSMGPTPPTMTNPIEANSFYEI